MCIVHLVSLLFFLFEINIFPIHIFHMECKNFEAQYLKTAQNADRTL